MDEDTKIEQACARGEILRTIKEAWNKTLKSEPPSGVSPTDFIADKEPQLLNMAEQIIAAVEVYLQAEEDDRTKEVNMKACLARTQYRLKPLLGLSDDAQRAVVHTIAKDIDRTIGVSPLTQSELS